MSTAKRLKRDPRLLEDLPNELIFKLFSYLSHVEILSTFTILNQRFKQIAFKHCSNFDFKSISKSKFDYIIDHHYMYNWQSLRLSDGDDTPGQITCFHRRVSFSKHLSQLKILSIMNMKITTAALLTPELSKLNNLVSLSIGSVCGRTIPTLKLPTLKYISTHCCLDVQWIKGLHLHSLEYTIENNCIHEHNLTWPTSLQRLKVFSTHLINTNLIYGSLKTLTNLRYLAVLDKGGNSPPPNGQLWQDLIVSYLPLLDKFDFCFKFFRDYNVTSDTNRIIATFSSSFYLVEKRWFVQCDVDNQQFSTGYLYSLPYAFEHFEIVTQSFDESISTLNKISICNSVKNSFENVKYLTANASCKSLHDTLTSSNVIELNIKFFGKPNQWLFSMTKIYRLSLGIQINMSSNDFISILKNAPYLNSLCTPHHTLKLLTNNWKNKVVSKLLSLKIRTLEIQSDGYSSAVPRTYVRVEDLLAIVKVFSQYLNHLNITVYSRNIVAGLILRTMTQLYSLNVRLAEHNDDLKISHEWLITQDSSFEELAYFMTVDRNNYSFWFRR